MEHKCRIVTSTKESGNYHGFRTTGRRGVRIQGLSGRKDYIVLLRCHHIIMTTKTGSAMGVSSSDSS